jgi:TetR/AcrR family transcriptional regulator, transcriptional repressor for nem operon
MARPTTASETSTRILDIAERLVQTRGFNAFSYADVAKALNVTKASLHYHFATKAELGESLVARYRTSFLGALQRIDETCSDAAVKLSAYVGIYVEVLENDRMCLCGMLGAEYATLPTAMQDGVRQFFDANEAWLVHLLSAGREHQQLAFTGPPIETARLVVSALEGSMLLARSRGDRSQMRSVAMRLLTDFGVRSDVREGSIRPAPDS